MHLYGLFSISEQFIQSYKPILLQNVKVSANVIDVISEVKVRQTYKYTESNQIQAIYKFPILHSSAICYFEAKIGERTIKGIVEETEQATKKYEEATKGTKEGNAAFTIDDQSPDSLYCLIGTISSGQTIEIELMYVSELQQNTESEGIRFVLPAAIAPKHYYSLERQLGEKNFDLAEHESENCKVEISVTCRMTSVITSIESPTHSTITDLNDKFVKVDLNEKIGYLEKDFVLVFSSQELDKPRALMEYNPMTDTNCIMLTLVPQCTPYMGEMEFIFIVDVSFSQTLNQTLRALELVIHSLPEDSFFNIISRDKFLFPEKSQRYSRSTFIEALEFVQNLSRQSNSNDFNLYSTLQPIFNTLSEQHSNLSTKFFYLTNSYSIIQQFESLVELFQQQRSVKENFNFFTLFIGDGSNNETSNCLESLTKLGKGYSTCTSLDDKFEKKLISIVKNSLEIPLSHYVFDLLEDSENIGDVELIDYDDDDDIEDESGNQLDHSTYLVPNSSNHDDHHRQRRPEFQQIPTEIPLIYNHHNSTVYFLLDRESKPPKNISIKAQSPQGLVRFNVSVDSLHPKGKNIHILAARKFIELVEDDHSSSDSNTKDQIISLGKMYHLISSYTSFLAIDEQNNLPISIYHQNKSSYNSSTYFNFKDFTRVFSPSYTSSSSSELYNLNLNPNSIISRYTGNLTSLTSNLLSNPVSFLKDNLDDVMNQYSYEKLTLGIRHKHPIYYLGNGLVIYGSVVYEIVRKFESFPIFGELLVRPVVRFIDDSIIDHERTREEFSFEEVDRNFRENIFESHEEMVNPRMAHIETLFGFLKLFSFDGKILDRKKFYEFFEKDSSNILDRISLIDDEDECWVLAISLAYFEIVLWREFKEECSMCYHKSERAFKKMINFEDEEDLDEKYNEWLNKARGWIRGWLDNI